MEMLNSVLDCQKLAHYSDFDETSESGLSNVSYVHPYRPKKSARKVKSSSSTSPVTQSKRGARATRRHLNEAYLNTLAVIAEVDTEQEAAIAWPDSSCSAFTKLFEDENIRAVWDMFIKLSEMEQAELLASLNNYHNNDRSDSNDTDEDSLEWISVKPNLSRSFARKKSRHNYRAHWDSTKTRGHTSKNLRSTSLHRLNEDIHNEVPINSEDDNDKLQSHLSSRLLAILYDFTPFRQTCSTLNYSRRRNRHQLTPLDLCLLKRVEYELRRHFSATNRNKSKRWTPSISLTSHPDMNIEPGSYPSHSNLLLLDSFHRFLIHSVAAYLGLNSYSVWSNSLGERQLWVEHCKRKIFDPPKQYFLTLIEEKLNQLSIKCM